MAHPIFLRAIRLITRVLSSSTRWANQTCLRLALRTSGVAGAPAIRSFTLPYELGALYDLGRHCPPGAAALEIGSYLGASACYIAAGLREVGGRLYCVDTWQNETMPDGIRDTLAEFKQNTRGVEDLLCLVRKRSDELTTTDIPDKLDLIFIDGDHSYEAVKADFLHVTPWLTENGIVAFHDHLFWRSVTQFIGEALASGAWVVAAQSGDLLCLKRSRFAR